MDAKTMPPLPEPDAIRVRYRSEPGMIGHYPWSYFDHDKSRTRVERPSCEYEELITAARARDYAEARTRPLVEALMKTVELAEFWINREDTRDMPESAYAAWLALGHHSNAMRLARAALAAEQEHTK